MRIKHMFSEAITVKCPFIDCGKTFEVIVGVNYVTNEKGDVIEHNIRKTG